jgi:hypothetical protein
MAGRSLGGWRFVFGLAALKRHHSISMRVEVAIDSEANAPLFRGPIIRIKMLQIHKNYVIC